MRSGQEKYSFISVSQAAALHYFALARQRSERKAIRDRLPESGEVRDDSVNTLCPSHIPAKPGDHFIKHQESAKPVADGSNLGQKTGAWRNSSLRFENNASDLAGMRGEEILETR